MIPAARRRLLGTALTLAASAFVSHAGAATPLDLPPRPRTFRLDESVRDLSLLRSYFYAEVERPGPYSRYIGGAYGRWAKQPWFPLLWNSSPPSDDALDPPAQEATASADVIGPDRRFDLQLFPGAGAAEMPAFLTAGPGLDTSGLGALDALFGKKEKPVIDWRCRRRPVLFIRHNSENDRFSLVRCDGSVELGAIDRLSIVARPPEVPAPGDLPDEPDPAAWQQNGEWLPRVKLVNPRLVWLLQKISDAFPYRAIYVYSGYRPLRDKASAQGHHSMHADGRAMDIQVHHVSNEALFQLCRKLEDVGCGYYPNSKFVHVDVRRPGTGHAFWVDTSGPGEPSHYVDSWPGVVERGALAWMVVPPSDGAPLQGPRLRTPHERGTADTIRK